MKITLDAFVRLLSVDFVDHIEFKDILKDNKFCIVCFGNPSGVELEQTEFDPKTGEWVCGKGHAVRLNPHHPTKSAIVRNRSF